MNKKWAIIIFTLISATTAYVLSNIKRHDLLAYEASLLKKADMTYAYNYFRPFALKCQNDRNQWLYYSIAYLETQKQVENLKIQYEACVAILPIADREKIASYVAERLGRDSDSGAGNLDAAQQWKEFARQAKNMQMRSGLAK